MLTGYIICVPLKTKQASEVLQVYIDNIYAKFRGSLKILSDNGTEFKNQLFEKIAKELGVEHKSTLPLIDLPLMVILKVFTTFSKLVFPNACLPS